MRSHSIIRGGETDAKVLPHHRPFDSSLILITLSLSVPPWSNFLYRPQGTIIYVTPFSQLRLVVHPHGVFRILFGAVAAFLCNSTP
jgi:hypothetical protein